MAALGTFYKSLKLAHPSLRLKIRDLRSYFWPLCLSPSIKVMSRWWCKTLVVWLKFTRGVIAMKGKMLLIFWCMLILGNCNMKCLLDSCLIPFRLPFIQLRERERERVRGHRNLKLVAISLSDAYQMQIFYYWKSWNQPEETIHILGLQDHTLEEHLV